jgi:hypothetical protein
MADNEPLRKALEHYIEQRRAKLDEVRQLDLMIGRLSRDIGDTNAETQISENLSDSIGDAWQEKVDIVLQSGSGRSSVRPDEFFGMTYSTAAKMYLEKVGHAVSVEDLLEALNRGGCQVGGREPKKTLYISLVRDVRNFVPISGKSGYLGLRKFYPNLKAVTEMKSEKGPKSKRKKGSRKKPKDTAVAPRQTETKVELKSKLPKAAATLLATD